MCKFKFTGGAQPSLQEKKMLSVDAKTGNFRYFSASGGGNGTSNGSGSGARNSASNTERSGRRRHKSTRAHFRLGKRIWGVETSNSFESGIFRSRSRDGRKRKSGERTEVSGLSSADFSSNGGFPRARSESQSEYRFVGDDVNY